MLYQWDKKEPVNPPPPLGLDPIDRRPCAACGYVGRPRMSWMYRIALVGVVGVFLPLIWTAPWLGPTMLGRTYFSKFALIPLFAITIPALFFSRNAYRCARCGGILY